MSLSSTLKWVTQMFPFCLLLFPSLTSANEGEAEQIQEGKTKFIIEGYNWQKHKLLERSLPCQQSTLKLVCGLNIPTVAFLLGEMVLFAIFFFFHLWLAKRLCPFFLDKDLVSMTYIFLLPL